MFFRFDLILWLLLAKIRAVSLASIQCWLVFSLITGVCCEISSVAVLNLFPKRPFILPRPIWFYVFLYLKVLCSKSVSSCSCGVAGYLWSKALPFVSWFCFYLLLLLLLLCLLFCLLLFSLFLSLFILFQGSRSCFRPHPCCCCCCCSCSCSCCSSCCWDCGLGQHCLRQKAHKR